MNRLLHWLRSLGKALSYAALIVLLVVAPLVAVMATETGSRWLLNTLLALQPRLSAQVGGGTLLDGLQLKQLRWRGQKVQLDVGRLIVHWSLVTLLRGEVQVHSLQAQAVRIRRLGPPEERPLTLKRIFIPFRLVLEQGCVLDIQISNAQGGSQTLQRLCAQGEWRGSRVSVHRARLEHALGWAGIDGEIFLQGHYPLRAAARVEVPWLAQQGVGTLTAYTDSSLAELDVQLRGSQALPADGRLQLKLTDADRPWQLALKWSAMKIPGLQRLDFYSQGGQLAVNGDRHRYAAEADVRLQARHVPKGRYHLWGEGDGEKLAVQRFEYREVGQAVDLRGELRWKPKFTWQLTGNSKGFQPARYYKVPPWLVPAMTGKVHSTGLISRLGSRITADLGLTDGRLQFLGNWPRRPWVPREDDGVLSLKVNQAKRLLPGIGETTFATAQVQLKGHPGHWQTEGTGTAQTERLPTSDWQVTAQGDGRIWRVQEATLASDWGQAFGEGRLAFGSAITWQGPVRWANVDTTLLRADYPGRVSGQSMVDLSWQPHQRALQLSDLQLQGELKGRPLQANVRALQTDLASATRLPQLHIEQGEAIWGGNRWRAQGGLTAAGWSLDSQLTLTEPELIVPDLRGNLELGLQITGPKQTPSLTIALQGDNLSRGATRVGQLSLSGTVNDLGQQTGELQWSVHKLQQGEQHIDSIEGSLKGSLAQHTLVNRLVSPALQLTTQLSGGWQSELKRWRGELESGQAELAGQPWQLEAVVPVTVDVRERSLRLAPWCWRSPPAWLCSFEPSEVGPTGRVAVSLEHFELTRLKPWLPTGFDIDGTAGGEMEGRWVAGETPRVNFSLSSQGGALLLSHPEGGAPERARYDTIQLSGAMTPEGAQAELYLLSPTLGSGSAHVQLAAGEEAGLSGDMSLSGVRLAAFKPFLLAANTLDGQLGARGRLAGSLQQPQFFGDISLRGGRLELRDLPVAVQAVEADVQVDGSEAVLNGHFQSGTGEGKLSGKAAWQAVDKWQADLHLSGRGLAVRSEPMLNAILDPELSVQVKPGLVDVRGRVSIPEAKLALNTLGEKAVPLSNDVVVTGLGEELRRRQQESVIKGWTVNADVELSLGDAVAFSGFDVTGKLGGNLRLQQYGRRGLSAMGEVLLDNEAQYRVYGQRLRIRRGRLLFAGPVTQPSLDIEAIREVDNKVVGIRVQGTANQPSATLFSDEPMSQDTIVSYLLFGQAPEQGSSLGVFNTPAAQQGRLATTATFALGAFGGEALLGRVGEEVGVSDVQLATESQGENTFVTVSGHLSSRLYLRYGVGVFSPVNKLTLRYRISRRFYLEAVSSLENAINFFYSFKF